MKRFKKLVACLLSVAILLSLTACGEDANVQLPATSEVAQNDAAETMGNSRSESLSETSSEAVVIKFASPGTDKQPPTIAMKDFFSQVEEKTNGKYKFDLYTNSALGADADILQQVIDGTLKMSGLGITTLSMYSDKLEVLSLPFLITDYDKEYKAVTSDEYHALCDAVGEQIGIKILFTSENGIRHFATVDKPIKGLNDLKGLKIRIPVSNALEKAIQCLDANPVTLPYNELYSSLQNHVIDGEEVNYSTLAGQKHYEVAKYVTEVGFYCFAGVIIANLEFWNNLPEEERRIMEEASDAAMKNSFESYLRENEKESKDACIANGMEITELTPEQLQAFKDATAPVLDEYREKDPLIAAFIDMAQGL